VGEFGIGVFGVQFLKGIIHLQIFCVVLMGWVFIKTAKGRKETFFLFNVWGCFEIILNRVWNIVSNFV